MKNIGRSFDIYPMPVVIVGTVVEGRPNFMTAAWITKLNSDPPLLGLAMGHGQHSAKGIHRYDQFSVNFPSVDQAALADYCGLVHGHQQDKASRIEVVKGALDSAPMVGQCPLTMECWLNDIVNLPRDFLFIGEVANVYASEEILTNGVVDVTKLRPFVLTMPDNGYWALGERIGDAWSMGKSLLKPS
jgi:flavin reductase (DIM6/NTAB) family NADH-FMN oxidoreductase RutF